MDYLHILGVFRVTPVSKTRDGIKGTVYQIEFVESKVAAFLYKFFKQNQLLWGPGADILWEGKAYPLDMLPRVINSRM